MRDARTFIGVTETARAKLLPTQQFCPQTTALQYDTISIGSLRTPYCIMKPFRINNFNFSVSRDFKFLLPQLCYDGPVTPIPKSSRGERSLEYNRTVVKTVKVPEDQFKAVMRALLSTPPMPASTIRTKRSRKPAAKLTTKRRG